MNNRENIWMMQNKFVILQSLILIAMARLARSGTGETPHVRRRYSTNLSDDWH